MARTSFPKSLRSLRRRAYDAVAPWMTAGDPLVPPARLHTVGPDVDFRASGDEFFSLLRELVDLQPDERVLDVGCGTGRIARPLAGYLNQAGSYDGFDVAEIAIKWCKRHYARAYPNFTFTYVDVANTSYNPDGGSGAENFVFPYADASFDFVFLASVFTHMLPAGIERYVDEIARVLAPDGRCLATFFLLNDESRRLIGEGRSTQGFSDVEWPCAVLDSTHLEDAVAFDEGWALGRLTQAGLSPRAAVNYGGWCGREEFTSYQDIAIADKPAPRSDGSSLRRTHSSPSESF
jgi:SAM-dependent methyltransferase